MVNLTAKTPADGRLAMTHAWRYFALTFLVSWFFWGIAIVSPQEWAEFPNVLFYVLGGVGPLAVAVLFVHRRLTSETPRKFWMRLLDWRRVRPVWWLAIVAVALVPNLLAKLVPSGSNGATDDGNGVALVAIIPVAILAGLAEEPGWRGYALDRLLVARSALVASLFVGLVWTLWHLPFYFIEGTVQQEAGPWSQDFWFDMANRVPLAILFTWIYVNTDRSILSAVALHAVDNLASVLISPEGDQLIVRLIAVTALAVLVTAS